MNEVVIVAAKRSAVGSFLGSLKSVGAREMGVCVLKDALKASGLKPSDVDSVILGNVLGAGLGQNIARQIQLDAGIPNDKNAFSVNMVCGSSMKAIQLAHDSIVLGRDEVVVCGGVENMSAAPYLSFDMREGKRMGNANMIDSMIHDGLWDAFNDYHMGITADNVAQIYHISREEQDNFALQSQLKARAAINAGKFQEEITPIEIANKKGVVVFKEDEYPRDTTLESLAKLKPAFKKDGSVTAGNSSGINDGASIIILCSAKKAQALGLKAMATIKGFGLGGCSPDIMGICPSIAIKNNLKNVKMNLNDIHLFELNEAFAAQSLAVLKELELNPNIVNVNGGAIAIGHPIGASGARILVTLLHEMKRSGHGVGCASLCVGGGQGLSVVVEQK
ncbi:acetyl-CoA C-acetyltransferase [Helicobacter pylori]|uniref:acetyl-CoA C-acetyltransferase n=1 Tax=Helicobacter pylori TaxID=210 RepID=UPI000FDD7904|nr:acetyl-CoA C-acetyltransferase [Helicobacter pylori]RVZ13668.1 acetyl-CoA C-acetyltransferase [Helicobacter pylori]WQW94262.1 acetyl-CoA C-acetyltransferase [Helicobacter pylori]